MLEESLALTPIPLTIADSSVVGSLVSGNSNGFIVSAYATESEISILSSIGLVARLPGKMSAAGNIILANDTAALVHPGISSRAIERIAETLRVDVKRAQSPA